MLHRRAENRTCERIVFLVRQIPLQAYAVEDRSLHGIVEFRHQLVGAVTQVGVFVERENVIGRKALDTLRQVRHTRGGFLKEFVDALFQPQEIAEVLLLVR